MKNTNIKEQIADSNGAHTEQPIINQLINEFREWNRQWDLSQTTMTIDEFNESLTKKYHVSLSNSSTNGIQDPDIQGTMNLSNKTLLPDNVNTPEEYLEYMNAIGYWDYVKKLEKFKEQMSNDNFKKSPIHDKNAIIQMMDELEPQEMIELVEFITVKLKDKKQTALEKFIEKLEELGDLRDCTSIGVIQLNIYKNEYIELKRQAKEMEKEQQKNTWEDSRLEDKGDNYIGKQKSFEDYYNETYGGNK
jgi:hypothetical protein